jgi:hypothetical protein
MTEIKRSADLPLTIRPVVGLTDCYPSGFIDDFHTHERAQLAYAFSGVMSVVTDSSTFVLPPNRAIWIPAGVRHMVSCRADVSLNVLYVDPNLPDQPDVCRVFDVPSPSVLSRVSEVFASSCRSAGFETNEARLRRLF